jgi:peptidase E
MKLLLASKEKFLIEKGYSLLGIPKADLRIGYIDTAFKVVEDVEYIAYMNEYEDDMHKAGIRFEPFDLKDKSEEAIRTFFADKNVIQVSGGNPFYLLKNARESGFDTVLKELLDNGLAYVGCSSGSYLMCPTVEVGGWKTSRNKHGVTDFTALGYVPFLLKCHYTEDQREVITVNMRSLKYPLRVLRDDQCFLINETNCTFVGEEAETIL